MNLGRILGQWVFTLVLLLALADQIEIEAKQHVKYSDDWAKTYPQCNPQINKYLSPININTKTVKPTSTRTLLTYSYEPIKNYTLHSGYYDKVHDVAMSGLTITVDELIFFECTYINGLGYENFQVFDKAVFFFSKSPLQKGRSFHQINGTTYPMEIMFYFTNKQLQWQLKNATDSPDKLLDNTLVFVLVEFQEEDNQVWFPVIEAARRIKKMKSMKVEMDALQKRLDDAKQEVQNLTQQMSKMININSSTLKYYQSQVGPAIDYLDKDTKRKADYEKEFLELQEVGKKTHHHVEYMKLFSVIADQRKQLAAKRIEVANSQNKSIPAGQVSSYIRNKLKRELQNITDAVDATEAEMQHMVFQFSQSEKEMYTLAVDIAMLTSRIGKALDRIKKFQTNKKVPVTQLNMTNSTMFRKVVSERVKVEEDLKRANQTINETMQAIELKKQSHFWSARMTTFQATWLFPAIGGYYAYNGSIPLPPCQNIRYTIVLENTIKISKKQYDLLASIPSYESYEPLDQLAAPLRDLGSRTVWYNKKFIQFQRDDGLHIKSIVRAQMKRSKKKNKTEDEDDEGSATLQEGLNITVILGLVILLKTLY